MSSSEVSRRVLLIALVGGGVSACTFRPMYGSLAMGDGGAAIGDLLARTAVTPLASRSGVNLRNELLFRFTGGGNEPADPAFRLDFQLSEASTGIIVETISGRPSGFTVISTARYTLIELATQRALRSNVVVARASFDRGIQRFADQRAERDAQDRAVRSLADLIRNDLAAYFTSRQPA